MHYAEIQDSVGNLLKKERKTPFTDNRPGKTWLKLFLNRHKVITQRNTEIISKVRAVVTEKESSVVLRFQIVRG